MKYYEALAHKYSLEQWDTMMKAKTKKDIILAKVKRSTISAFTAGFEAALDRLDRNEFKDFLNLMNEETEAPIIPPEIENFIVNQ
jgi:hypothetical protein